MNRYIKINKLRDSKKTDSVVRSKIEEFPAKIMKFPQFFPTIFKIPKKPYKKSQSGFLLHFY